MLAHHLRIALTLAMHDVRRRYAPSALGPLWLALTPLAMLAVYATVFGMVLKVSWPDRPDGVAVGYVLPFFAGYAAFLFFADMVSSSLGLFVAKRNYVRKSPFPLWVIWLANLIRAAIQGGAYLALLLAIAVGYGTLTFPGLALALLAVVGIVLACAAISLLLSAIGPFLGDLGEGVGVAMRVLFYAAPVTYPLGLVPESIRPLLWANPLTHMIEPLRSAVVYGEIAAPIHFAFFLAAAALLAAGCWWFFGRVARAVPDVV